MCVATSQVVDDKTQTVTKTPSVGPSEDQVKLFYQHGSLQGETKTFVVEKAEVDFLSRKRFELLFGIKDETAIKPNFIPEIDDNYFVIIETEGRQELALKNRVTGKVYRLDDSYKNTHQEIKTYHAIRDARPMDV